MHCSLVWFDLGVGAFAGLLAWAAWRRPRSWLKGVLCALVGVVLFLVLVTRWVDLQFVRTTLHTHSTCQANLLHLQGAKEMWALDYKKTANDVPQPSDLFGVDNYIKREPTCPAGGTYLLGSVQEKPRCSRGVLETGHQWKDRTTEKPRVDRHLEVWVRAGIGFIATLALAMLSASLRGLSRRHQGVSPPV